MVSEQTQDLVLLTRRSMEASNRGDFDASATMFAPDAVFDVSAVGVGIFHGRDAIHAYLADWMGSYESQELREWHGEELGGGIVFVVSLLESRPLGSESTVQERWAFTVTWEGSAISRVVADTDVAAAREDAERRARATR
jgi:ketosteroid isomerase-like protein